MAIITNHGRALIAQQQGAGQPLIIDRFIWAEIPGLDHTAPPDPDASIPDAGQIKHDAPPSQSGYVNPDTVVYSSVLDSTVGTWSFNWLGLASGNTLVAVSYVPDQIKTASSGNTLGNNLTKNFAIQYQDAATTSGITISADTWQIDWTARLSGIDQRERLANLDIYGRQAFFNDAFLVSHNGTTGSLAPGLGYLAGIRIKQISAASLGDVGALPKSFWLDVALQGDISGVTATATLRVSSVDLTDYTDPAGQTHYLEKIATIDGAGQVTDLRNVVTLAPGETLSDRFLQQPDAADETSAGVTREASLLETVTGTLSGIFVSPAKLRGWWDQARTWGNILNKPARYPPTVASQAEVDTGTDNVLAVTPATLNGKLAWAIEYRLIDWGTITNNTRYVKPNPFGNNTPVIVLLELFVNDRWSQVEWTLFWNASQQGNHPIGAGGYYVQGEGLVVQTAQKNIFGGSDWNGGGHDYPSGTAYTSAPARMHVWKLGDNP